jgi:hypothetical protein
MGCTGYLRQRQGFVPVAAEVLEGRALLSAGAAAAHAAQHHAVTQAHAVEPHAFHGSVIAVELFGIDPPKNVPGSFSISNVKVALGAKMTAHFNSTLNLNGLKISLKATYIGTVNLITPQGQSTVLALTPTGGKLVLSEKGAGVPHVTATAISNGSTMHLTQQQGLFEQLTATYLFGPNEPLGFANQPISFKFTL